MSNIVVSKVKSLVVKKTPTIANAMSGFVTALQELKEVAAHHDAIFVKKTEEARQAQDEAGASFREAAKARNIAAMVARFVPEEVSPMNPGDLDNQGKEAM